MFPRKFQGEFYAEKFGLAKVPVRKYKKCSNEQMISRMRCAGPALAFWQPGNQIRMQQPVKQMFASFAPNR